jgi:tetratricopeptide (TPR) repeat protein
MADSKKHHHPKHGHQPQPQPAAYLVPLNEAFNANVRGAFMSASETMLDTMWEVAREEFAKGLADASPREAQALHELEGACFIRQEQPEQALEVFEGTLETARSNADPRAESRALYNLGVTRCHLGEYDVAEHLFQQALQLGQSVPSDECVAFATLGLARIQERARHRKEAAELHQRAFQLAEGNEDPTLLPRLLMGPELGFEHAIEELRSEIQSRDEHIGKRPALGFETDGDSAYQKGQMDKARVAYRRMLLVAGGSGSPAIQARALGKIALTHVASEEWPTALKYLHQALDVECQYAPPSIVAVSMRNYASATAKSGDHEGAIGRYVEAYRYCQMHEDIERLRRTAAELIASASRYGIIDRLPLLCAEHGLSPDEFAQLLDEGQKWIDLSGGPDELPDSDDDSD